MAMRLPELYLFVSIHAPRAERDPVVWFNSPTTTCFNPRAPGGARLRWIIDLCNVDEVSIHAPRAERDILIPYSLLF